MFSVLFLLSIACGALLFVKLASSDAWLAKGIKEDRVGAVVVACFLGVCAVALLIFLYMFLPLLPASLAEAFAAPSKTFPAAEDTHEAFVEDIIRWFLLLCIPILSAYLLYLFYRAVHWVIKKSVSLCVGTKSR